MQQRNHSWLKAGIWIAGIGAALLIGTAGNLSARSAALGAPSGTLNAAPQASSNPNLAGHWTLNKDQSDDPRQKMQEAMGNNGGGNGEGGGGYGGGGGQGGGHRGQGGGRGGHGPGGMMADMSQLTIEQTATSVKVSGASGRVLAANPAEQASKPSNGGGNAGNNGENEGHEYTPPVAKWQGSQLTTSNENPRGGSTTRTYELSSDGKQLIVTTKMQNPRMSQPVTIRFVYDQTKANSGSSN